MTIVLNEKAKADIKDPWDFTKFPVVQYIAQQQVLKGMEKANIIFNLGLVYADLINDEENDDWRLEQFRKGKNVNLAMTWDKTPQGHKFWEKIDSKLNGGF